MSIFDRLRYPARIAGFVGLTTSYLGLFELDALRRGPSGRDVATDEWGARYGRGLMQLFGLEVDREGPFSAEGRALPGVDARGVGRLFVMNHRSAYDIFVALAHFEARVVSRADLASWPIIGRAARRSGTLFVDRTSKRSGAAVIQAMQDALTQGLGVMIFPEGTTYEGDEVRTFAPGSFHAAAQAGAEVVPVGLAYERLDSSFLDESIGAHMGRLASAEKVRAALTVGEPIRDGDTEQLRARARAAVVALVARSRARVGPAR